MSDNFNSALLSVVDKLNVDLKDANLFTVGSQNNWSNVSTWITTGSTLLDAVMTSSDEKGKPIGTGGWCCGRWYEVFGEEGMGKSTLVEHAFSAFQRVSGIAALIDSESKLYKPRAVRIGVDLQRLVMSDAPYVEKGVEAFTSFMEAVQSKPALKGCPMVWAWDTLASAPTKKEYEEGMYAGGMAEKARITRQMYRDLTNKLPGFNTCFILVNQVSDTMNGGYGKATDTTGGRGAKFHASVRMELHKFGVYNDPDNADMPQGIMVRVKFVKSSLFKPYAEVELPFNFETGIDDTLSLVHFHTNLTKYIQNKRGIYYCPDYFGKEAQGKRLSGLLQIVREDDLFQDILKQKARENASLLWKKAASYTKKEE